MSSPFGESGRFLGFFFFLLVLTSVFFVAFGSWFIWISLLADVILVALVHRCTVPNRTRGYAESADKPLVSKTPQKRRPNDYLGQTISPRASENAVDLAADQ